MFRWRTVVVVALWAVRGGNGWWSPTLESTPEASPRFRDDPAGFVRWWGNHTAHQAHLAFEDWRPGSWDGIVWSILDTILSGFGWMIFGQNWASVRSGCSLVIRIVVLMALCLFTHYILSLCWPLCSLFIGTVLTVIWILRGCVRCCGRATFHVQRWTGGVPEAVGARFFGPGTGEIPETAELRKLKKAGDGDRWVVLRRGHDQVIVKVVDSSGIKSNGVFLTIEPEFTRGDAALLLALQGYDKVHLCRHDTCQEDGQHFKLYALASELNAERFHLATSAAGSQRAGTWFFAWMRRGATTTAKRLKDYTSESEPDDSICQASKLRWEDSSGRHSLGEQACTEKGAVEAMLLEEDRQALPAGCALCPTHALKYAQMRASQKCSMVGCYKLGYVSKQGLRVCGEHEEAFQTPPPRRTSRSRSRTRELPPAGEEGDEPDEGEGEVGLRRRVRPRGVSYDVEDAENTLKEVRAEEDRAVTRRRTTASPGHTPKSSVQHSLAKLGMINSPDRKGMVSILEEFMEQLVDGKTLGLEEEDVRKQMAAQYGRTLIDLTKQLFEQATEEQRKGTKGLTKFLAKWRKQTAASDSSSLDGWSVVAPNQSPGQASQSRSEATTPREHEG